MKGKRVERPTLSVVYPNAAGVDIGGRNHMVCVPPDRDERSVRTFGAFTEDLRAISQWLRACGIKEVALEATGVYWIPLFELLDRDGFEVWLVNGRQTRQVRGRKSDVLDAQWIQQLMSHGLLSASFRPGDAQCAVRAMVRARSQLIRDAQRAVQHMDKALVQMNVQVGRLLADLSGQSGLAIIRAILRGERCGKLLAELCHPRVRTPREIVAKSLEGNWRDEHLFALRQALERFDLIQRQIDECDVAIEQSLLALRRTDVPMPERKVKARKCKRHTAEERARLRTALHAAFGVDLTAIPTIEVDTAILLYSEIGPDLTRFPDCAHFCSWLNLAPGTRISGGKALRRTPAATTHRAADALKQAAANARLSDTFIGACHRARLARMPKACAVKATAHQLARLIYAMLTAGQAYVEQGIEAFERQREERQVNHLRRRAAQLGYQLTEQTA